MTAAQIILVSLLLLSCQRTQISFEKPKEKPARYDIFLFASLTCKPCKEELPEISKWYAEKILWKTNASAFVYLTDGNITDEKAKAYCKSMNLRIPCYPDKFGKLHGKYYSGGGVPGTVVVADTGKVIKLFPVGKVTPEEIWEVIR